MGISLEWAGGSSAPPLTPKLPFPRGTAPGKEEPEASQGTGARGSPWDTWEGPAGYSMAPLCLERQFPANSPFLNPFPPIKFTGPGKSRGKLLCVWMLERMENSLSPREFHFQTKFAKQFLELRFIPCLPKDFEGSPGSQVGKGKKPFLLNPGDVSSARGCHIPVFMAAGGTWGNEVSDPEG